MARFVLVTLKRDKSTMGMGFNIMIGTHATQRSQVYANLIAADHDVGLHNNGERYSPAFSAPLGRKKIKK